MPEVATKRIGQRVRNHTGRVDVMASKIIDEIVKQRKSPTLTAIHAMVMPSIVDPLIHYYLGPRNQKVRKVTRIVRTVVKQIRPPQTPRVRRV